MESRAPFEKGKKIQMNEERNIQHDETSRKFFSFFFFSVFVRSSSDFSFCSSHSFAYSTEREKAKIKCL